MVLRQALVFGLVGIAATSAHYLAALGSHELLLLNIHLANLGGYLCGVGISYVGHGKLTFQVELSRGLFRRFVVVSLSAFSGSAGLLALLESMLLPHRVSLAIVILVIPILSFLLNKFWVYRRPCEIRLPR